MYLDGLRGVAILLVAIFHGYYRYSDVIPYGNYLNSFSLARYGWLGVELFFMISGFVIYMSVEKYKTFGAFMFRRWVRLFPAMLFCSLLIFITAHYFPERPAGLPTISDVLSGLLFIDPAWLNLIISNKLGLLEGAFWSLFVEFKFYILFGFMYYYFGKTTAKAMLFISFFSTVIIKVIVKYSYLSSHSIIVALNNIFSIYFTFGYFIWFLIGVLVYELRKDWSINKVIQILFSSLLACLYIRESQSSDYSFVFAAMLITIFIAPIYNKYIMRMLTARLLIFYGFISYPFYLLHENFMIATLVKLSVYFPSTLFKFLPMVPIAIVTVIAYIIAKWVEPWMAGKLFTIRNILWKG